MCLRLSAFAAGLSILAPWLLADYDCKLRRAAPLGSVLVSTFYASCEDLGFARVMTGAWFFVLPVCLWATSFFIWRGYQRPRLSLMVFVVGWFPVATMIFGYVISD